MKLWLVRHAQPLVEAGVCFGASDLQADTVATQACAAGLAPLLPPDLPVFSSPLQRCTQLTQALSALRPDLRLQFDARLVEMDFGVWEGQRWDAIPREAYEAWTADFGAHRFGGRESVNELLHRVAALRSEVMALGRDALWVTHGGVLRALTVLGQGITQLTQAEQWPQEAPRWGEWQVLTL